MSAILNKGFYEAYFELRAQVNDATRAKAKPIRGKPIDDPDDFPF
jgi:hypothetical protein